MDHQLDFWRQLVWEMVEKTLDGYIESGGFGGRRMISSRGTLGGHELMKAPKYCGKWLVDKKNGGGSVKQPY